MGKPHPTHPLPALKGYLIETKSKDSHSEENLTGQSRVNFFLSRIKLCKFVLKMDTSCTLHIGLAKTLHLELIAPQYVWTFSLFT